MARDREPRAERKNSNIQSRELPGERARAPESCEPGKKVRPIIRVGFVFSHPPSRKCVAQQMGKRRRTQKKMQWSVSDAIFPVARAVRSGIITLNNCLATAVETDGSGTTREHEYVAVD